MTLLGPILNRTFAVDRTPVTLDASLAGVGARIRFARDQEIFAQDEPADLLYQVVSGVVRTSRLTADGRRQVGDFYYPGDFFGLEAGESHRFTAEALDNCEVLVLRRNAIDNIENGEQLLNNLMWAVTSRELRRTQEHLMLLGRRTACEKVASFLLDAADRIPGERVDLPMGRQDMADYLGLTIETVSRMITQLQADGIVRFESCRQFRILRRTALARLLD